MRLLQTYSKPNVLAAFFINDKVKYFLTELPNTVYKVGIHRSENTNSIKEWIKANAYVRVTR